MWRYGFSMDYDCCCHDGNTWNQLDIRQTVGIPRQSLIPDTAPKRHLLLCATALVGKPSKMTGTTSPDLIVCSDVAFPDKYLPENFPRTGKICLTHKL